MTMKSDRDEFQIHEGLWKGYDLYELYSEAHTPFEWHQELFAHAKKINITIFSTPFDESAVDLLDDLGAPAFKIASFEITDLPLIKYAASKNKPMFLSTGMANVEEISAALEMCQKNGNGDILLFHCISNYPAELNNAHLGDIKYLEKYFNVEVGLSDHTISNMAAILSVALGASAIEKHFKLDTEDCGPDSSFSILPAQLKTLCDDCNLASEAITSNELERPVSESLNKKFRRSIYFSQDLKKGAVITENDLRRIRPGYGLNPEYFSNIIGMRLIRDVSRAEPVSWEVLTDNN